MALVRCSALKYPERGGLAGSITNDGASHLVCNLSASTDVLHQTGRVRWSDGGTHDCNKVYISLGSVTLNAASSLRVGFQNLQATNSRGDATFTNYGDITSGAITAVAKLEVPISPVKSIASGDITCVTARIVPFTTGDSINLRACATPSSNQMPAVWINTTLQAAVPNLILEASDGTFGTYEMADFFASVTDGPAWSNSSGTAERGVTIRMPFTCKVNGIFAAGFRLATTAATMTVRIYSDVIGGGEALLYSVSPPINQMLSASSSQRFWMLPIPEITLTAGVDYGISFTPTSSANVQVTELYHDIADFGRALAGGYNYRRISRAASGGGWGISSAATLQIGFLISALDDGAATTGGGLLTHPGMDGGMRG